MSAPSPAQRLRRRLRLRGEHGERGFTLVWSALLLTTLMLMAAFSVDVGSWYNRATAIQRAADAAALAGVVGLPDLGRATSRALEVAKKNGFDDADPKIDIVVTRPSPRRLKVTITDHHVPAHFGRVVTNEIAITRSAIAEYTEPILLGSPQNYLGAGDLNPPWEGGAAEHNVPQNFWLSVNGYCTAKEEGDFYLARYDGTSNHNPMGCGAEALPMASPYHELNPDYSSAGYTYAIVVPTGRSRDIDIDFYDIAYCPDQIGSQRAIDEKLIASGSQVTTYIRVRFPDNDGTPFNLDDDDIMWEGVVLSDPVNCARFQGNWWTPNNSDGVRGPSNTGGASPLRIDTSDRPTSASDNNRYHVEVWTQQEANSFGFNNFSIRASIQGGGNPERRCDVRGYAQCPQVSGETALSVYADAPSSVATFYLAQVQSSFAGKSMVIQLWDPGEGGEEIRIFNPDTDSGVGSAWPFAWRTLDGLYPTFTEAYALDVSGTGPQPGLGGTRFGTGKFNDRAVEMVLNLPTDYAAADQGWWKLRYQFDSGAICGTGGSGVCDRTTWMVRVVGDPVHLARE